MLALLLIIALVVISVLCVIVGDFPVGVSALTVICVECSLCSLRPVNAAPVVLLVSLLWVSILFKGPVNALLSVKGLCVVLLDEKTENLSNIMKIVRYSFPFYSLPLFIFFFRYSLCVYLSL